VVTLATGGPNPNKVNPQLLLRGPLPSHSQIRWNFSDYTNHMHACIRCGDEEENQKKIRRGRGICTLVQKRLLFLFLFWEGETCTSLVTMGGRGRATVSGGRVPCYRYAPVGELVFHVVALAEDCQVRVVRCRDCHNSKKQNQQKL
jgi:hypothetical protein